MKKLKKKDILLRSYYFKKIKKKIILKKIFNDQSKSFKVKEKLFYRKKKIISIDRLNNICLVTYNSNSVFKKFKMSRITFRMLTHKGLIPGISKSSW